MFCRQQEDWAARWTQHGRLLRSVIRTAHSVAVQTWRSVFTQKGKLVSKQHPEGVLKEKQLMGILLEHVCFHEIFVVFFWGEVFFNKLLATIGLWSNKQIFLWRNATHPPVFFSERLERPIQSSKIAYLNTAGWKILQVKHVFPTVDGRNPTTSTGAGFLPSTV